MSHYLFIITLMVSNFGNWCSCEELGKINDEQYKAYDVIIKVKITKIKESMFEKTISIRVETYYKGKQSSDTVKIVTPASEGECGISPKLEENWLVFAYYSGTKLKTILCTRTKTMNPKAWDYKKEELEDDLKFLQAKRDSSFSHNGE